MSQFEIFKSDKNAQFYFRLKADNGEIVASSEGYTSKHNAKKGIDVIKRLAVDAPVVDLSVS